MIKLNFDKHKYGNELLIDTVDMTEFKSSVKMGMANFYALGALEKVSGEVHINQTSFNLVNYTVFFFVPGTTLNIEKMELHRAIWIFFEGDFLDFFFNDKFFTYKFEFFHGPNALRPLQLNMIEFEQINRIFREVHSERQNLRVDSQHFLRSSLYLLLMKLNRSYGTQHNSDGHVISDVRILRFKTLLEKKIKELHTVQEFAQELKISKTLLNNLCKVHFGKTCNQLISEKLLLEIKKELIFSKDDISEIAYAYHFSDPSNFVRFFKRHMDVTPSEFRKDFSN